VHTLRTLEDAVAIRDGLASASSLAVVGGGFIGAEVAATARGLGVDVTLIETLPTPLSRVLGTTIGDVCGRLHADHGVILRCGVPVTSIEGGDANVELLRLADGSQVAADLVVVGLGVTPNTDWLAGSGLKLGDGALCDQYCRTAAPHIVAAGDVARWDHPSLGSVRIEHWQNAVTQGRAAAASLLDPGLDVPFDPVPYVWSDQYDVTIQVAGRPEPGDDVTLVDTAADQYRFSALYSRDGRLTAGVSFGRQAATRRITRLLQERASVASAIAELREPNQIARSHDPGELPTATAA
jgi:NADPH-dependent 2,4-dienoyl-CoA reductase/sulfur reductase-like enzyme